MEKFFNKVNKNGPIMDYAPHLGKCWVWKMKPTSKGYGVFWFNKKINPAHRFSYELMRGKIQDGLVLDHLCRNTMCVNPDHLEPVTNRENIIRGIGSSAKNFKKTHCLNGHELIEENLYSLKTGPKRRLCKICHRERWDRWRDRNPGSMWDKLSEDQKNKSKKRAKEWKIKNKKEKVIKTHCKNGHEYTIENTGFNNKGRFCKACTKTPEFREKNRIKQERYRERKKIKNHLNPTFDKT